jgi:hypothetical protein
MVIDEHYEGNTRAVNYNNVNASLPSASFPLLLLVSSPKGTTAVVDEPSASPALAGEAEPSVFVLDFLLRCL